MRRRGAVLAAITISCVLLGVIPTVAAAWQGANAFGHPGDPGDWLSWLLTAVAIAALVALCWAFARWVLVPFTGEAATDPRLARAMRRLRVGVVWLAGTAAVWAGVAAWVTVVNASCPPPRPGEGQDWCGFDEVAIAVLLVSPVVMISTAVAVVLVLSARHRATATIAEV